MSDKRFRSYTKKGPGRYHGQGLMVTLEPPGRAPIRLVRSPKQRLAPTIKGGAYVGVDYLSYAEHDRLTREAMGAAGSVRKALYAELRRTLIAARYQVVVDEVSKFEWVPA